MSVPEDRQKMIGVRVDDDLLAEIDRVRGAMSRSDFVRKAAYAALKEAGTNLDPDVVRAPDRTGKGGPRPRAVKNDVALVREESTDYKTKKKK